MPDTTCRISAQSATISVVREPKMIRLHMSRP